MTTADVPNTLTMVEAVARLRAGYVIALPTDTVYGIAASLEHPAAIERIFEIKGRATTKAIPLLVSRTTRLNELMACQNARAQRLVDELWPGALTVVVRANTNVPAVVRRGLPTVGVRMPDLELTREVIELVGGVLAVTSANLSGEPEALSASEVRERLGDRIDGILDGGPSPGARPSTVVDISGERAVILRVGLLSEERIRAILNEGEAL